MVVEDRFDQDSKSEVQGEGGLKVNKDDPRTDPRQAGFGFLRLRR